MKELFSKLERINLFNFDKKGLILVDTCFFVDVFDKNRQAKFEEFCEKSNVAITSFNSEEILYNIHRFHEKSKDHMRKFLKNTSMMLLEISVFPGNRTHEEAFVSMVDPELLQKVSDPSDAVLVAAAIRTNATILTKDKHHLFTVQLENFLNKYKIKVYKELKEVELFKY